MKYSVSLYSFFSAIRKGTLTPMECIGKAKELGFDAIEIVDFVNANCPPEEMPQRAKEIREEADKYGLEISSVAIGADFLNGSGGDTAKEVERVKQYVDFTAALGAPRMRHDVTHGFSPDSGKSSSYDSVIPALVPPIREVAEYAAQKGVMTMTENHGFFSQDSDRVEKLYNAVNHPNFALLCDMGNFMCADEDPALAVARVAPYVKYVHAKDFVWKSFYDADPGEGAFRTRAGNFLRGTIIGHGNVPVKQCLHVLKAAGYNDTVAIEFEGMEDPIDALRIGLANLKRYWEEV
ncbi:MAG: sugar phosphate isomerase/epimerase [Acutalibacter sp.]|nr:sugar phosphate isomerase/epimerase [Acutalibacter sp.]